MRLFHGGRSTRAKRVQYRPEVDGLRAVAVLPVLLFHAVPALVPGGYLGVDVFFVISGFLITGLLIDDLQAGRFSLARFYERRARRILPALLVVIAATLLLAWGLMLPRGFDTTARSAAAAAAFLSNVFFWQKVDYFDIDAIAQPLLHTWSLAVEEQFYILFPLLLAGLWRWVSLRVMLGVVGALLLGSLALAEWGSGAHAKVNYFFTFSRFWEMLLGAVGAFVVRGGRVAPSGVGAAAGLGAIVAAMALFTPATPHPGVWTLIPTLGALAVLIWARPGGLVAGGLSLAPVVGIGKISYSLYLWHFPVFSFAVAQGPVSAEPWNIAAQIALTFVLSVISWHWVETPFRSVRPGQGPARALWVAGGALVVTIALGQGMAALSQMTLRYLVASPQARAMLTYAETMPKPPASAHHCFLAEPRALERVQRCLPEGQAPVVIWGDSHASALGHGLNTLGIAGAVLAGPGCAPVLDDGVTLLRDCARQNPMILRALQQNPPRVLVLHAYWRSKRDQLRLLKATVATLRRDLPQTRIVVLGGMPYWLPSLPERIVAEGVLGQEGARIAAQLSGVVRADDGIAAVLADEIAAGEVVFLRPTAMICAGDLCPAYAAGQPYAFDYGHLTIQGAADVLRHLEAGAPQVWAEIRR